MRIQSKADSDPIAALKMVDAYMRWALMAAEEVVGKQGMPGLLHGSGLERLAGNYPPDELSMTSNITFGDYANLNAGLLNLFVPTGKNMALRIGRLSAKHAVERQSAMFNLAALAASKMLPTLTQVRMGLEAMQSGYRRILKQGWDGRVEDRGATLAYITGYCPMCAGKQSDRPICWIFCGTLQEAILWQTDKYLDIEQTACRAMGAPECVWEVSKTLRG